MPVELSRYVKHPYMKDADKPVTPKQEYTNALKKIFILIRMTTGHDFSNYKMNTIRRRIERRMAVHQIDRIVDYLRYLHENVSEVETLYKDMLITVTNFFRDSEAFDLLAQKTIPEIVKQKNRTAPYASGCRDAQPAKRPTHWLYSCMRPWTGLINI
jgi:two-component system CheB/CheR fusion protein